MNSSICIDQEHVPLFIMKVQLQYCGKQSEVDVSNDSLGSVLYDIAKEMTKLKEERIRIDYFDDDKKKKFLLRKDTKISETKVKTFNIKDLGPQIKYSLVFYLEYLGPFLIFPILLFLMPHDSLRSNNYMAASFIMWMFHFAKRLLETMFVHSFSHTTMPLFNVFKNCSYYYLFALMISFSVILKSRTVSDLDKLHYVSLILFFICEMLNLYCHLKLKFLRPKGSKEHFLPKGFLFDSIISPNYTTEVLAWFSYSLFTRVITSLIFCVVGAVQMYIWALKKKKSLSEEFPVAKKRGAITPFF